MKDMTVDDLISEIWAAGRNCDRKKYDEAADELNARFAPCKKTNIKERVKALMDNKYIEYIGLCRRDECLGVDFKIEHDIFKQPELKAHTEAAQKLGEHRAYADVLKMLSCESIDAQNG